MTSKYNLPYHASMEEILNVFLEVRNRTNPTDEEIRKRVTNFEYARKALMELGLIERRDGKLVLTEVGSDIAWDSSEEVKKEKMLTKVIMNYEPYEIPLTRAVRENQNVMISEHPKKIWVMDLGLDLSNETLKKAMSTYFKVLEYVGVGQFKIGRRGAKTRFELSESGVNKIKDITERPMLMPSASEEKLVPANLKQIPMETEPQKELLPKTLSHANEHMEEINKHIGLDLKSQQPELEPKSGGMESFNTKFFSLKIQPNLTAVQACKAQLDALEKMYELQKRELEVDKESRSNEKLD